jgi:hypothetical protein
MFTLCLYCISLLLPLGVTGEINYPNVWGGDAVGTPLGSSKSGKRGQKKGRAVDEEGKTRGFQLQTLSLLCVYAVANAVTVLINRFSLWILWARWLYK